MTTTNDFLTFAVDPSANVESQSDYAADAQRTLGFQAGVAPSDVFNKVWRQSAFMAAVIAAFIQNNANVNVNDDGNLSACLTNYQAALAAYANTLSGLVHTTGAETIGGVKTFSAAAVFSASPSVPTATPGDNTTKAASTAFVTAALAGLIGGMVYQGTWNASTNTPTLTSSVGTKGFFYKVSVAGTTTLNGISTWGVNDIVTFDGAAWDKIDGATSEATLDGAGHLVGTQFPALTGAITTTAGSLATTLAANAVATANIQANAVTLALMAALGANTVIGSVAGGTPAALSQAQLTAMLNVATSSLQGAVPASGGGTTNFLRADMTWASAGTSTSLYPYGGDGSDGAVLMDGANTFAAFASKASNIYTLTRDVFATTFQVNSGVTLLAAGFRIFASVSVIVQSTGVISCNGGVGGTGTTTGGAAGVGASAGANGGGGIGGVGVAASGGVVGTAITNGIGGVGGTGGNAASGGVTGAVGGTIAAPAAGSQWRYAPRLVEQAIRVTTTYVPLLAGSGGGSGAAGSGIGSGGGGGGGGILGIYTPTLTNNGTIQANGGAGGSGGGANGASGGGGGGGAVFLIVGAAITNTGTIQAAGGAAGASVGGGTTTAATAGSSGVVITIIA